MSQQTISLGAVAGDGTGETLRAGGVKINSNFTENYASIASINASIAAYGSPFSASVGGTGVNNGTSTITIGGNTAFSGAYTFWGTLTGNTTVTFPTSGTLINSGVATLSSLTSIGTIGTGTWQGTAISPTYGGTGVNNGSATLTMGGSVTHSGAFTTTLIVTGNTTVTLPTSGTLVNSAVTTLSSLVSIGTISTGTWNGTLIGATYGGTGVNNGSSTITIGGNVTVSGAFTTTFTVTGNTSVTLPTSGTLMLDLLKSRGIITFTFLLNEPLPIDTEILPAALDFAIKPKPTHFEQIKHRFLSHRPTAIVVIAFLVVAAVIALLRQAGIIG
jgi:hypothetical protein